MTTKRERQREELKKMAIKLIKESTEFVVITPENVVWSDDYDNVMDQITAILVPHDLAPSFPEKQV